MEKRINLIITIIGITIIIIAAVFIKFQKNVEEKEQNYIKENLVIAVKKCIKEEKCLKNTITLSELLDKNYINDNIKEKLNNFSEESYITYPNYVVTLIEDETEK